MGFNITKSNVDALPVTGRRYLRWDDDLKGFGIAVSTSGKLTYVAQYRTAGGRSGCTRRYTIGRHGSPWTPKTARDEARRVLAEAAMGGDPAAVKQAISREVTLSELCDLYLLEGVAIKKQSTLATDRGRIERHIKPLIGHLKLRQLNRSECERLLRDVAEGRTAADIRTGHRGRAIVRGGRGTASRTLGLLGGICTFAVRRDLLSSNPVHGIARFPDRSCDRFLSSIELARLGRTLRNIEGLNPLGLIVIQLLLLTGCRYREVAGLRWSEVHPESHRLKLSDGKNGGRTVLVSPPAMELIRNLEGFRQGEFVFPASRGDGFYKGTPKVWQAVRAAAELPGVRLHDLRHTFASAGVNAGLSLQIVGTLLGHKDSKTTMRYAHLSPDPVNNAHSLIARTLFDAISIE